MLNFIEAYVIVTLTFHCLSSLCIPSYHFLYYINIFFYWSGTGAEDEARHAEVRSDLPRPAGGAGQHQAQGQGQQDARRQGLARMQVQCAYTLLSTNVRGSEKYYTRICKPEWLIQEAS